jgi:hypothetical protein
MRRVGIAAGLFALTLAVAAVAYQQDEPERLLPGKKKDAPQAKPDVKKEAPAKKPDEPESPRLKEKLPKGGPPAGKRAEDKEQELLARVAKNMEASDTRLKKEDPGEDTRKIQDDILKDLDELIKKQQDQDNQKNQQNQKDQQNQKNQGAKGGQKQQSGPPKAGQGKTGKGQKPVGKTGEGTKDQPKNGKQQPGKGSKDDQKKEGAGKEKDKGGKDGKDGKQSKDKGNGTAKEGGGGKDSAKKSATVADLYRDVWGHLPESRRQEMEIYSRERFLPRYEELLRQYYRTIAEQGRRKTGD